MKIVFMGTPAAAVPSLERLVSDGHEIVAVYTQPDRPSGRGNRLASPPVKMLAQSLGITVLQPERIRSSDAVLTFEKFAADVAVVVAYGRILPESYLSAFRFGAINVHFSLLPKYRGAAPVNWAIVNGEKETGITTMRMDEGLDTGNILLQRRFAIGSDETAIELMGRLAGEGAALLSETLSVIDTIEARKQAHDEATLAPIMKKADGLIDWTMRADEISRRVRGFQPFPGSFSHYEGKKLTFWRAAPLNAAVESGRPGTVVRAVGAEFAIECGDGTVLGVSEIQIEGKRRMQVRDFLNGVRIPEGAIIG